MAQKKLRKSKSLTLLRSLPSDAVYDFYESPFSRLTLIGSKRGLHAILWDSDWKDPQFCNLMNSFSRNTKNPLLEKTKKQLEQYFNGKRTSFELPLAIIGSVFQKSAWEALQKIPFAQTRSYQEQALLLGDKNKVRAVGNANGCNPLSIVIPCHRVIAKSGALHGYGGGLDIKKQLIDHEARSAL